MVQNQKCSSASYAAGCITRCSNPGRGKDYSLRQNFQIGSGVHPASYTIGTGFVLGGQSGPGREVNHVAPSMIEVRNEWSCTSSPPVYLHDLDRDNF
jgi:hypothetical protein